MDQLKESNPSPKLLTSKNCVSHLCILSFRLYIDSVHKYKLSFGLIFFFYIHLILKWMTCLESWQATLESLEK